MNLLLFLLSEGGGDKYPTVFSADQRLKVYLHQKGHIITYSFFRHAEN